MSSDPENAQSDRRSDGTRFRQGVPYSAPERASGADFRRLALAGGAMLAATLLIRLAFDAPIVAIAAGVAVFILAYQALKPASRDSRLRRSRLDKAPQTVREAVAEAEEHLAAIDAAAAQLAGRQDASSDAPARRLSELTAAARAVIDVILEDPLDYDRARKFFKALLPAARSAADKYVALPAQDAELAERFDTLATDLIRASERLRETLRADDRFDLEVEMEVLSERVRNEEIGPAPR